MSSTFSSLSSKPLSPWTSNSMTSLSQLPDPVPSFLQLESVAEEKDFQQCHLLHWMLTQFQKEDSKKGDQQNLQFLQSICVKGEVCPPKNWVNQTGSSKKFRSEGSIVMNLI